MTSLFVFIDIVYGISDSRQVKLKEVEFLNFPFIEPKNSMYFDSLGPVITEYADTILLPASPQSGDQVRIIDLAGTFDTNNLTISRNSLKIMGLSEDLVVSQENAGIGLVYTGATYGWKLIEN